MVMNRPNALPITEAFVVPAQPADDALLGVSSSFAEINVDDVLVTVYRTNQGAVVIDVSADTGQLLTVTLNDGDLFREKVPE